MRSPFRVLSPLSALALLAFTLFSPTLASGQPPEDPALSNRAPRELPAEVAARVEQLEKEIDGHRRSGAFEEALVAAQELAALRAEHQSPDHWQAQDARREVDTLRLILGLPEEGREAIRSIPSLIEEESALFSRLLADLHQTGDQR